MIPPRPVAAALAVALATAAALNYVPGLTDASGRAFGVFALDIYDDTLHGASALWAGIAAFVSRRAAITFLRVFGTLYLADGLMGLAFGSGYLDLGIVLNGIVDLPLGFKALSNLPHLLLGGIAVLTGFRAADRPALVRA